MKPRLLLFTAACMFFAACGNSRGDLSTGIIPAPQQVAWGDGAFRMPSTLLFATNLEGEDKADLAAWMRRSGDGFFPVSFAEAAGDDIPVLELLLAEGGAPESYRLDVARGKITVTAPDAAGLFYGLQSLGQLAEHCGLRIPAVVIEDAPRFGYRGFMLDVSRHFRDKEFVKRQLDLLARYKFNRFHWHLTDGAGWRIEIKKYPALTDIAAWRPYPDWEGWNFGGKRYCRRDDPAADGGYYTQNEIREVVEYARALHIEVIPEIEMPGHSEEVLAVFPELSCSGKPYLNSDFCIGNEQTFEFLENVLSEVIGLFPSEYIHIGGDEASKQGWRTCPKCAARMRKEGLKDVDELQSYMIRRIETFLNAKGRRLLGWDEILEGGLAPDATVMSWRGTAGGIRAADEGFDVIMSPNSSFYFDYYQSANIDTEPPTIGGYIPLKKVYDTEPVPEELTPEQARHIIGVQANVWATYMRTDTILEHMLLPRLAALAERAWSDGEKDFTDFMTRLDRLVGFYDRDGYSHFPHFYDITGSFTADYGRKAVGMTLSSLPGADIRYTLDGSEPTEESPLCTDTVWIGSPAEVRAVAVLPDGRRSEPFCEEVTFNKATMKPIRLLTAPHPKYAAAALNDGLRGKRVFTFGNWAGWQDDDMEAVIDLGRQEEIAQVAFNALLDYGSHIMDAAGAKIWVSDDGETFREVHSESYPEIPYGAVKRIFRHEANFSPALQARYVKLRVMCSAQLPDAYFDRNLRPFLFIDEIYVY